MAASKGFSLIETLVAVVLASIAVLALMQVISHSSRISINVIERFDDSLIMGLIASDMNQTVQDREITVSEMLKRRYVIDHPTILESFKDEPYRVHFYSKENVDPLMSLKVNTFGTAPAMSNIAIQKISIENLHEKKIFFRITSGTP